MCPCVGHLGLGLLLLPWGGQMQKKSGKEIRLQQIAAPLERVALSCRAMESKDGLS